MPWKKETNCLHFESHPLHPCLRKYGTFTNCFKKSGISEKLLEKALNNENNPFASLDVEENVMKEFEK